MKPYLHMRQLPRFACLCACVPATATWMAILVPGALGTALCGLAGFLWALFWKPWRTP